MCVACWGVSYVVNFHCCWAWQICLYAEGLWSGSTEHVKCELQYAMVGWNKVATVFKLLLGVNKLMCVIIVQSLLCP